MTSFLIDRNSPIRTVGEPSGTGLHHRSRHSTESENGNGSPHHRSQQQRRDSYKETAKEEPYSKAKDDDLKRRKGGPSMFSYFKSEVTRNYKLEGDASEFVQRRDRIYVSVNTPKSFEKFCAFGLLQCLDSFLYIMTFLPLRILVAIMNVLTYPCSVIFFKKKAILNPAQICDLLKGVILVVSCFITSYIDTSMVYHIVRSQSTIKFYVIYNMLDVMDKLISGFGQDVLDSLYWTAVEPRGRKREHFGTIFHLMFAIAYVVIHTALILIQAITLNVAFNSHNKSLLTIMLSNNMTTKTAVDRVDRTVKTTSLPDSDRVVHATATQSLPESREVQKKSTMEDSTSEEPKTKFVEIKANLFKRLDKNTLCQITYVDVKERFHYFVLLLFILIHNLLEKNWLRDQASIYFIDVLTVLGTEVIVDWIKHSFITKINEFSPSYYHDFAIGLAQDIASSQKKHALTDFSDQVCRRMGFTPIPLTCLLYMVCRKSFDISGFLSWFMVFMLFLCLFTTKVLNSIILLGWAQYLITQGEKQAKSNVIVGNSQVAVKKDDNKADKKRIKTESISHCPDMTSHVPLTPQKSDILTDSRIHSQTSPASTSSLPLQAEMFPVSDTYVTNTVKENGNQFAEYNVEFQSLPPLVNPDSPNLTRDSNLSSEEESVSSEALNKALNAVLDNFEDKQEYVDNEIINDCRHDTYNIQLQDVSDRSLPLLQESETSNVSFSSEASSSLIETKDSSPLPKESNEPFMLKLSSSCNSPPEKKNDASVFDGRTSFSLPSQITPAVHSLGPVMESNFAETVNISGMSDDVHLFTREEAGDSSPRKATDL